VLNAAAIYKISENCQGKFFEIGKTSLRGGMKTYTGIKGDSCMRRNDAVADVMPADAGISTKK